MKRIKNNYIVFFLLLIISNLTYSALSISSGKVTVETISTSEGEDRIQYFSGVGKVTISRTANENAYLGLRLLENAGKHATVPLLVGKNQYELAIEGDSTMGITVNITNISVSAGTVQASGESPNINQLVLKFPDKKSSILSFDYSITVKSKVNTINRAKVAIAIDSHKNFVNNNILAAEFIEVNLEDNGSLMGVTMGSMDFGNAVIFGSNTASADLTLKIKPESNKIPMNTLVQLDPEIKLTPISGVGDIIPVTITLGGNVSENGVGKYWINDLNNNNATADLKVIGKTNIDVGQKSGAYKGNINIRITYTK
ncbi:MAG: hypothetical protein ACRC54_08700 [Fusobacteriaceae bacterium]